MFCNYNIQCEKIKPYNEKQEKRKGRTIEIEKNSLDKGARFSWPEELPASIKS